MIDIPHTVIACIVGFLGFAIIALTGNGGNNQ